MSTGGTSVRVEQFVLEMDGRKHSSHAYFFDALTAALLLRNEHNAAKIKLRDLSAPGELGGERDSEGA